MIAVEGKSRAVSMREKRTNGNATAGVEIFIMVLWVGMEFFSN